MENRIRIVNLNSEDVNAYNVGELYSYGNKWITFGSDNLWPNFLRTLYLQSPTHQTLVNGIANMIAGGGVFIETPEKNPLSNKFLNENFDIDTINKLSYDLKLYGWCTAQVIDGNIVKYSDAINYRYAAEDENGNITHVWYSNDWSQLYNKKQNKPVLLPIYTEGSTEKVSVLIACQNKFGFKYSVPDYHGGLYWIDLEREIATYHLSNIKNGLAPSFLINYPGTSNFTQEQMDDVEYYVNKKLASAPNVGRPILDFCDTIETAAKITTIDVPQISEQYQFLTTESTNKILLAHGGANPLLFGIHTEAGWSSNSEEMMSAYSVFFKNKIEGFQTLILNMIEKIMIGNMLSGVPKFKNKNPFEKIESNSVNLSKYQPLNEVDMYEMISEIDEYCIKPEGKILKSKIFNGRLNSERYYKFIKSSNKTNMFLSKMEILSKKGYYFVPSKLIKNTEDYYFQEYLKIIE